MNEIDSLLSEIEDVIEDMERAKLETEWVTVVFPMLVLSIAYERPLLYLKMT